MVPELSICFMDSSCACTCECVCVCVRASTEQRFEVSCGDVCHNIAVKIQYIVTAVNNSVYYSESRWFAITRAACAYSPLSQWMLLHWNGRGKWQSSTNKCTCNKAVWEFSGCFSVADAGRPLARSLALPRCKPVRCVRSYLCRAVINIRQVDSDYAVLSLRMTSWLREA